MTAARQARTMRCIASIIALVVSATPAVAIDLSNVVRRSDRPAADIAAGLRSDQRFAAAAARAAGQFATANPASDAAAQAAVDQSMANALARRAGTPIVVVGSETDPIRQLLIDQPDHRRALFLQAAANRAAMLIAQSQVAAHRINPSTTTADDLSGEIIRLATKCNDLADQAAAAARDRQTTAQDDFLRLHRSLIVRSVTLSRLQSGLNEPGSTDAIAAAAATVAEAEGALTRLLPSSPAARQCRLLLAAAQLDAAQLDAAQQTLRTLTGDNTTTADIAALQMQFAIARGQIDTAMSIHNSVHPPAPPTDLAALDAMLRRGDPATDIARWATTIGDRHGTYARRLAEAKTIRRSATIRSTGATDSHSDAAALIAMQAAQRIRTGDRLPAGRLYAAAVAAMSRGGEPSADPRRIQNLRQYGLAAAATLRKDAPDEAIDALVATAEQLPDHLAEPIDAAALTLAAEQSPTRVADLLRTHVARYHRSETIDDYRRWLVDVETDAGRPIAAAITARGPDAIDRWSDLFAVADQTSGQAFKDLTDKFIAHLLDPSIAPEHTERLSDAAPRWLDTADLTGLDRPDTVRPDIDATTFWRWLRDGRQDPRRQKSIAAKITRLDLPTTDMQSAMLRHWSGDTAAAVRQYDQIAATAAIGSPRWFNAKTAAIKILAETHPDQATARTKYILLTNSLTDDQTNRLNAILRHMKATHPPSQSAATR